MRCAARMQGMAGAVRRVTRNRWWPMELSPPGHAARGMRRVMLRYSVVPWRDMVLRRAPRPAARPKRVRGLSSRPRTSLLPARRPGRPGVSPMKGFADGLRRRTTKAASGRDAQGPFSFVCPRRLPFPPAAARTCSRRAQRMRSEWCLDCPLGWDYIRGWKSTPHGDWSHGYSAGSGECDRLEAGAAWPSRSSSLRGADAKARDYAGNCLAGPARAHCRTTFGLAGPAAGDIRVLTCCS